MLLFLAVLLVLRGFAAYGMMAKNIIKKFKIEPEKLKKKEIIKKEWENPNDKQVYPIYFQRLEEKVIAIEPPSYDQEFVGPCLLFAFLNSEIISRKMKKNKKSEEVDIDGLFAEFTDGKALKVKARNLARLASKDGFAFVGDSPEKIYEKGMDFGVLKKFNYLSSKKFASKKFDNKNFYDLLSTKLFNDGKLTISKPEDIQENIRDFVKEGDVFRTVLLYSEGKIGFNHIWGWDDEEYERECKKEQQEIREAFQDFESKKKEIFPIMVNDLDHYMVVRAEYVDDWLVFTVLESYKDFGMIMYENVLKDLSWRIEKAKNGQNIFEGEKVEEVIGGEESVKFDDL